MKTTGRPLRTAAASLGGLLGVAIVGASLAPALGAPAALVDWLVGARLALVATLVVASLAFTGGVTLGATAALGPSWLATGTTRALEVLGALPTVIVAVVVRSLAPSDFAVFVIVLGGLRALATARAIRSAVIGLEAEDFVLAARAMGSGPVRLFRRHLFPHVVGQALSSAALSGAAVVALDAALSFLGLASGAHTWGEQIAEAARQKPFGLALFPLLGLAFVVAALHTIADALESRYRLARRFV